MAQVEELVRGMLENHKDDLEDLIDEIASEVVEEKLAGDVQTSLEELMQQMDVIQQACEDATCKVQEVDTLKL